MDRADADVRAWALRRLIELTVPVGQAVEELAELGSSLPGALVTITSADATRVLDCFLEGAVPAEDCGRWAGALRTRRDVAVEGGCEDLLRTLLFELASPQLFRPIDREFALRWKHILSRTATHPD